ncbi:hypothetical protein AGIG_G24563 [Arapaima gigas]
MSFGSELEPPLHRHSPQRRASLSRAGERTRHAPRTGSRTSCWESTDRIKTQRSAAGHFLTKTGALFSGRTGAP